MSRVTLLKDVKRMLPHAGNKQALMFAFGLVDSHMTLQVLNIENYYDIVDAAIRKEENRAEVEKLAVDESNLLKKLDTTTRELHHEISKIKKRKYELSY